MSEQNAHQIGDQALKFSLTISQVNVVLAGLQELQFKVADPVIKIILDQAQNGQLPGEPILVDGVEPQ